METTADSSEYMEAMEVAERKFPELDQAKGVEVQTDKAAIKIVPCVGCHRPLVVNTFYAPKLARCSECKGVSSGGVVEAPVPGRTDPANVRDMAEVLVNPTFAKALCPVRPDDEEHVMELKSVSHSAYHGPREFVGYRNGVPEFRQLAVGESVLHQCLKCKATVSYSTQVPVQLRRQNEVREKGDTPSVWPEILGTRGEEEEAA